MNLEQYLQQHFGNVNLFDRSFVKKDLVFHVDLVKDLYQLKDNLDEINEEYFKQVYKKSNELFEDVFREEESLYLIVHVRSERGKYQQSATKVFRQLRRRADKYNIKFVEKVMDEEEQVIEYAVLLPNKQTLNYQRVIKAICHQDFPPLQPRFHQAYTYYPEVFFVNVNRNIVMNIYDDRGCFLLFGDSATYDVFKKKYRHDIS
ncbi:MULTISPECIES: DUF3885 domain-containing protein [Exiguobacterium]|uniref:DUF3885 domain-containing protein n=1 Tax=Exiguobacterium TaxID=33986 RepID=UPI000494239D|nr:MULTISPECIES: hypothetical protein [Exiguobacterium]HCD60009.1 hypothetical protein [Exiguobacterium sp.]